MFKLLGRIFNPKKLGDSLVSGMDKAILTNEEKLDYMQKMLVLYEPYKLAQRVIAILFTSAFTLIHLMTAITHFIYVLRELNPKPIISLYEYNNNSLGTLVMIIVGFYFAGGVLEGTVKRLKK